MKETSRRSFIKAAGAAPLAIALTGSLARCGGQKNIPDVTFDVSEQIDPWIELDLDNLASNAKEVSRKIGGLSIMAVVKCNAYGHGAVQIASALQRNSGINHFAVVKSHEAFALREHGITGMILNLGPYNRTESTKLITEDISQSVFCDAVDMFAEEASKAGKKAKVHICLDTGMGRVGVPYRDAMPYIEKVAAIPEIEIEGIFTAMTEDDNMNPVQIERLVNICNEAKEKGVNVGIRHTASSAEVDRYPYAYLDMVRPGNCLVGLEPERQHNMQIKPVMSFKTRVIYVKKMYPGESISYHMAYKVTKEMLVATLPCGYSDGYPPVVSNKAHVLIRGKRHPVIAPITANHMMVDITGSEDIKIGDEVVLWGRQGTEKVTKVELEELAPEGTNTYRMATRTRTYLPRITV